MTRTKRSSGATAGIALVSLLAAAAGCSSSSGTPAPVNGTASANSAGVGDGRLDGSAESHTASPAGDDSPDAAGAGELDAAPGGTQDGALDLGPPSAPDGAMETGEAGATSVCPRLCATIVARACPSDDLSSCVASCEDLLASTPCGSAYKDLAACQADRPVTDFACDSGKAVLAAGACVTEGQLFADCLLF